MSEKPEALRLADILQAQADRDYAFIDDFRYDSATELRRLHEENERQTANRDNLRWIVRELSANKSENEAEIERLREALALAERLAAGRLAMVEQLTDEVGALRRERT
jgi:hypothetical protein